jgi:hypothetical protein
MEITVDKKIARAVDVEMEYFLEEHRRGNTQDTQHVCGYVCNVLGSHSIKVDPQYVEFRWHELLSERPEPKKPAEPSPKKKKRTIEWKEVEPIAVDYVNSLPPAEPFDENAARQSCSDAIAVLEEFKYNGRAIENLLSLKEKEKVRKLEREGFVRPNNTTFKLKDGKFYYLYYWEPHRGKAEEKVPEPKVNYTDNKCLKGEEELNRLDTELADGADIYLKDETWGDRNGEK